MNPQHAVFVTLLVAAVGGHAVWQRDAVAATTVAPVAAPPPAPAAASPQHEVWGRWLAAAIAGWRAHELTLELRRSDNSLTLQLTWRDLPAVADGSR